MYAFEFTMAHDLGIGVIHLQGSKQGDKGSTLGRCAGVGSTAFLIQTSFIADTDGMGIVMAGMHADLFFITGLIELAILLNVVVIADALPVEPGIVAGTQHVDREALVAAGGTAMHDNQIDMTTHSDTLLKPVGRTTLNGDCSQDRRDDCCDESQHLNDGSPINFNHSSDSLNYYALGS